MLRIKKDINNNLLIPTPKNIEFIIRPKNKDIYELYDYLYELQERETPKIIEKHGNWSPALCPNCRTELSEHLGDGVYEKSPRVPRLKTQSWGELVSKIYFFP